MRRNQNLPSDSKDVTVLALIFCDSLVPTQQLPRGCTLKLVVLVVTVVLVELVVHGVLVLLVVIIFAVIFVNYLLLTQGHP